MKIIQSNSTLRIYSDDLVVIDKIPVGTYSVEFNQMTGFYLVKEKDFKVDQKIYGSAEKKIEKILRGYEAAERNFGVLLSGTKGCGKTLFAKRLAERAAEYGLPVILVKFGWGGIEDFISSVDQPCIFLFDEFEKMYPKKNKDGEDEQNPFLSLLDGLDNGKKLFIITCNDINNINDYFLNRPGRFHYHFQISYPKDEIVRDYLTDNLTIENKNEIIEQLIKISFINDFTYDVLRAICFELNLGYELNETLNDLNIVRKTSIRGQISVTVNGIKYTTSYGNTIFFNEDHSYSLSLDESALPIMFPGDLHKQKLFREYLRKFYLRLRPDNFKFSNGGAQIDATGVVLEWEEYNDANSYDSWDEDITEEDKIWLSQFIGNAKISDITVETYSTTVQYMV